jgi:NifU-like protein involved in Fe-S cluster formation
MSAQSLRPFRAGKCRLSSVTQGVACTQGVALGWFVGPLRGKIENAKHQSQGVALG